MEQIQLHLESSSTGLVDLVTGIVLAESNTRPSELGLNRYSELRDVIREALSSKSEGISDWL